MVIKWRESYETGVVEMDDQHKTLIGIINQLYQILRDKDSYEELNDIYNELLEYTEKHFQHEEKLLKDSGYSHYDEQCQSHAEFVKKLGDLKEDLMSAEKTSAPTVYKFLREWWLNHIVGMDKEYGPHLLNR